MGVCGREPGRELCEQPDAGGDGPPRREFARPNGEHRLTGVEYFVLKSTWDAANGGTNAAPPTLFGADVPLSDHPPFGKHYELHVWIFQHNPSGIFASWNPTVSCP